MARRKSTTQEAPPEVPEQVIGGLWLMATYYGYKPQRRMRGAHRDALVMLRTLRDCGDLVEQTDARDGEKSCLDAVMNQLGPQSGEAAFDCLLELLEQRPEQRKAILDAAVRTVTKWQQELTGRSA